MPPATVFRSRHHPGTAPWSLVFARALVTPLATCSLPVMVVGLVAALEGLPLLPYLFVGFAGAVLAAFVWTSLHLRTVVGEVHVGESGVGLRSVYACTRPDAPVVEQPLYDLRKTRTSIILGVGDRMVELADEDWPAPDALLDALQRLLHRQRSLPS